MVLPLLLTACGDGEDSDSKDDASASGTPEEEAIKDALVDSLLDPSCDLITDEYLLKLSVFGAETVEEACTERMNGWVEPQYDEDDILVSDIVVSGDTATAVVGSELVNITTTYELMLVDGSWLVSCDDFNCDHLDDPSAEVS